MNHEYLAPPVSLDRPGVAVPSRVGALVVCPIRFGERTYGEQTTGRVAYRSLLEEQPDKQAGHDNQTEHFLTTLADLSLSNPIVVRLGDQCRFSFPASRRRRWLKNSVLAIDRKVERIHVGASDERGSCLPP